MHANKITDNNEPQDACARSLSTSEGENLKIENNIAKI